MQDLNWEVVSVIRTTWKKVQEPPIYITKNLSLYNRAVSCGEAYWRGKRALEDDRGHATSSRRRLDVTHHALRLY